ncbi:Predicted amidohydrolase [Quadrisphaera granulorum]|uniref:Putative amidohydrolase n=1 Tax=Quadrisphaera granulorum TaxID=317664 RepID=A0A316ADY6_9ACTN|nr:carbon-nitrogen family hydrolase [Quadrisphaera granulorum]PWJ55822.1 putative amidohydrolase [Quadrisphaera granulorum]SZE95319.1 Predicted amidohydrolase [Quadrisphaera granulorum]
MSVLQVGYDDDEPVAARVDRVAALVAEQRGADLVVLPELWAPGGFSYREWEARAEPLDGPTVRALADAARAAGSVVHGGSLVERTEQPGPQGRHLWNTSVVLGRDGALLASYRKVHRFGFGAGEPLLMEAGEDVVVVDLPLGADGDGDGDGSASTSTRTGLATCYDVRFPELFRRQVDLGAELVLLPAAWPAARLAHWRLLTRARAVEDQVFLVAVGTAGTHARTPMAGHSAVVSPWGEDLAEAGADEQILHVEVDLGEVARCREQFPVLADRRL